MASKAPFRQPRTAGNFWRRLAAHFALLAIAVQVLVVQPHIEPAAVGAFAQNSAAHRQPAQSATAQADGRVQAACFICQAAVAGRTAVTAPAAITFEPLALRITAPLPTAPPLAATPSHTWRSRGPPTLV